MPMSLDISLFLPPGYGFDQDFRVLSSNGTLIIFESGSTDDVTVATILGGVAPYTVTLLGSDSGLFEITGSAPYTLAFVAPPDYDAPGDANTDNDYLVSISAEDDLGATAGTQITVRVIPANRFLLSDGSQFTFSDESPFVLS